MTLLLLALLSFGREHELSNRASLFLLRCELYRFPSYEECKKWTELAAKHLVWIDARIALFPADRAVWQEYREQVVWWRYVWGKLRIAQVPPHVTYDWYSLNEVRAAIGEENYRRGFLYPPIAPWFLTKAK